MLNDSDPWVGLLIFATFWALFSGACVFAATHSRELRAASFWGSSFGTASVAAAYCFGRLL
jgi:hypothetical protein